MKKIQQILALAAVVIMILCALLTLVFALLTEFGVGDFTAAWKASTWSMVVFPAFLYAVVLVYRVLQKRGQ